MMDRWKDGWMDEQHNGSGNGRKEGWTERRKDGQHDSLGDGKKMDGRMGRQANQLRRRQPPHYCPQPWLPAGLAGEGGSPAAGWVWGGRRIKPWSLALLCSLLQLTGFAAPDLHSWVY